jgi:carbon-monoxide dehydrogenase medium subunit
VPGDAREAVALLASRDGDAKALAGGQSLVPMMAFRIASPSLLVDLRKQTDLKRIEIADDGVRLGAMVRWRDIEDDARLDTAHPLLKAAIAHVAHYQIRNRGTVGGSIAHADPVAELPLATAILNAEIDVRGPNGTRTLTPPEFFVHYLMTTIEPTELLTEVRFPDLPAGAGWSVQEFARRLAHAALDLQHLRQLFQLPSFREGDRASGERCGHGAAPQ